MSLRDDLIAAKALIDTPEKYEAEFNSDPGFALIRAVGNGTITRIVTMATALSKCVPRKARVKRSAMQPYVAYAELPTTTHADIMALFDRAIKLAEHSHG